MEQKASITFKGPPVEVENRMREALLRRNFRPRNAGTIFERGIRGAYIWTVNGASLYREASYTVEEASDETCRIELRQFIQGLPIFMNLADKRVLQEEFEDIVFFVREGKERCESRGPEYATNARIAAKFAIFLLVVAFFPAVALDEIAPYLGFFWLPIGFLVPLYFWQRMGGSTSESS